MLSGRTYVITGANTGVGRATALALASRGARLVLLCRSEARGADVMERLAQHGGSRSHALVAMDLADLGSVRRAAAAVRARASRVDALVNNAGVGGARGLTKDGYELAFGVNHLGHYLLTRLLLPALSPGARIVHLSSGSHFRARALDLGALERRTATLTGVREYAVSKLCVMLFHHELARRLSASGIRATTLAADPGDVASEAWRHVPRLVRPLVVRGMKSPEEGARTSVFCAADPSLDGATGGFFVDARPAEPSALSRDPSVARTLWEASARFTGLDP